MPAALPEFVPPMLARLEREPFDSDRHVFEVKWDGIRALAFVGEGDYRLLSRNQKDLAPRYPELAFLAAAEPGLVLDGELVVLRDGRPDFFEVLQREQAQKPIKIQALARTLPVSYVVFDVLYRRFRSVMKRPLVDRRQALAEIVAGCAEPRLVFSEGVVGAGTTFFEEVRSRELEGMVAKKLTSPYQPGRRTGAWIKVKPRKEMVCAILGYLATGDDLRSLIIGAEEEGELVCVGRVGSGLTDALRARLLADCRARGRAEPLIDCGMEGDWIEPGLFCRVEYLERTERGLRAPVFVELLQHA